MAVIKHMAGRADYIYYWHFTLLLSSSTSCYVLHG